MLLQGNFIPAMTTLIRRSMLSEVGPYDERLCYEDFDMWLRLSQHTDFVFSDYISAKYRIVSNSQTRTVLWTKSAPRYRSQFLIYSKCLSASNLSSEQRRWIVDNMRDAARDLRAINDPAAIEFIWKLLPYRPFQATKMLMLTLLSISPDVEQRMNRGGRVLIYLARRVMSPRSWLLKRKTHPVRRSSLDILRRQLVDDSAPAKWLRSCYYYAKSAAQRYPTDPQAVTASGFYNAWWYYSVELVPGITKPGIYPATFPLLPRIIMRNCNLEQMDCLDLGSMEGLIPTLMCRQGAKRVIASDATFHCYEKMAAVKHYYDVNFLFRQVGLMYGLSDKLRNEGGFDLINLSGILYHVFSPMHTIAGARALLKKNGLMIVATNVVNRPEFSMEFNDRGKLQSERNTFWYPSIPLFEYLLRYFKLLPIDFLYFPYRAADRVRFTKSTSAGYLCVVCRATDEIALAKDDEWGVGSMSHSWEWIALCDESMLDGQADSEIEYKRALEPKLMAADQKSIDLYRAVSTTEPTPEASNLQDSNWLQLDDQF